MARPVCVRNSEAKFETIHGRPRVSMRRRGERRQLLIPAQVDDIHFSGLNERPLPPAGAQL
jgi:hypothetical protein